MNTINILLIIAIGYILYILITNNVGPNNPINGTNKEKFMAPSNTLINYNSSNDSNSVENVIDDIVSWGSQSNGTDASGESRDSYSTYSSDLTNSYYTEDLGHIKKEQLNPNFINNQFNNDYRDVITGINNLIPDKKQLFNLPNEPVDYTEPEAGEVKNMLTDFIAVLNENLVKEVPSYRNPNSGWDEVIPDPTTKSGWDKVQDSLGLTSSLYSRPKTSADYKAKRPVKLVSIDKVQKYETEDEVKYTCDIVIQKKGVSDQMVLKASFVQDKRPLHDENNFFINKTIDLKIVIEDIYIIGYLSQDGDNATQMFDKDNEKFYDYDEMEYNNMIDPKTVQRVLMDKYKHRTEEMEQRNAMLDEEGQEFHKELPNIYDFSNIRGTQTIFDDMNKHRTFV